MILLEINLVSIAVKCRHSIEWFTGKSNAKYNHWYFVFYCLGARIYIDKDSKDEKRKIRLIGTPVKVEHARRLIEEKVQPRLSAKQIPAPHESYIAPGECNFSTTMS